jgi:capsular polysaccharide export protein
MKPGPSGPVHVVGLPFWKRRWARLFLQGADLRFVDSLKRLRGMPNLTVAVWGMDFPGDAFPEGTRVLRLEDGFLRSKGLGAAFVPPVSWIVDSRGIHFDASKPSDLEEILAGGKFDEDTLRRAANLRGALVASGITKYNVGTSRWQRPAGAIRVILVPGQVESDAAILHGCLGIKTNLELLQTVRRENPEARVLYKPHPDVAEGFRSKGLGEGEAHLWCDEVLADFPMGELLQQVDEVHTLTSLAGFEALLRGKKVVTYGIPFYAGWGLTTDIIAIPRRTRRLSVDELVAGALIAYPMYQSLETGRLCEPETTLRELQNWDSLSQRFGHSFFERIIGGLKHLIGSFRAARG